MNVDTILNVKGTDVVTVETNVTVSEAARTLKQKRIGAMVVLNAAKDVCGVISERDLVVAIADGGERALSQPVNDYMAHDVVSCSRTDTIDHLMALMTDRRIRHLPVIEQGKLVGIVSIGDIVKWRIAETESEAQALKAYIATG